MQTAALIAHSLKITSVKINYEYSESMLGSYFKENPMPLIEWWNSDPEQMNQEFNLLDVKFIDTEYFRKEAGELYPESYEDCTYRCMRCI